MFVELCQLLRRQIAAADVLEARLRTVELVMAVEEQRFVGLALDELETAAEELAALELARGLAMSTAGFPEEINADELIGSIPDADVVAELQNVVMELRAAMQRVDDLRKRATVVVGRVSQQTRTRLEAASALTALP